MDFTHKLAISYYKTIAVINEPHQIYLTQHQETKKFYVKKILDVYNADIYERLYNQNIIGTPKIIDYYEEDKQLIVIEEYISGCSLQEKIQNTDFSEKDILSYIIDLCTILEQLHSIKPAVIHRDIKPSNVIITNYNRAVLLDFNAAKYYSSSSTEDTVLLGTQGYAAPEQYGFGASSPQTDIYSLGVMLKEMLDAINNTTDYFNSIVNKCTQINPTERFNNIKELKNELSKYVKTERKPFSPGSLSKYTPPGYRTKTPWKIIIASLCYSFLAWLSFSLQIKNTFGGALWTERLFVFIIFLFIIFVCFNYMNIQKLVPLCKHKNRIVRYVGIAIMNIVTIFGLLFILALIQSFYFRK